MQLDYFLANRLDSNAIIPQIIKEHCTWYEWKAFKQYYPCEHEVFDKSKRKDKIINVPNLAATPDPTTGEYPTMQQVVKLNRIGLALQKLIVSRKTAFVTGGTVDLTAHIENELEQQLFDEVKRVWKNNKLQYRNSDIFKSMVSQTECAEIWYSKVNEDKSVDLRVRIYTPEDGFDLIPVFDSHGDLIAFGLGYKEKRDNNEYECLDIYDNEYITKHIRLSGGEWGLRETEGTPNPLPNPYGKIPVVYYQSCPAWEDVQPLIERLETLISNFGDVNDYNGSPILFAKGKIANFSTKGESGKVIESEGEDADLRYVSWDHAPESIKLEIETLENYIYTITQTPNISFKEMRSLGQGISGAAWDRIFVDAHLNARDYHNGKYGEGIQRRINLLKVMVASIETKLKSALNLEITPNFSIFSIDNIEDKINIAMKANGGKPVWTHKESVQYAGLSDDAEEAVKEINEGATATLET